MYVKSVGKSATQIGGINIDSTDATAAVNAAINLYGGATTRLALQVVEQTIAFRPITLNESGAGNVGIWTSNPQAPLHVLVGGTGPAIAARFDCNDSGATTSEARIVFGEGGN